MNKYRETCTCPHCRAKLQVREAFQRKLQQKHYFITLTACGEYQVLQMFFLVAKMEKGCKAGHYVLEIGQYWWNAQGRKTIVAVQRVLGRYADTFSYCVPMVIRNDNEAYRYVAYSQIYPKFKVSGTLRRNDFKDDFHEVPPMTLIPALLSDSRAGTLMKSGRTDHLHYFLGRRRASDGYWQSHKTAIRNGHDITDISLWCDYMDIFRRLNKDIHSPKFLRPTNLRAEHDRRQEELNRQKEREEIEQKQKKAMEAEKRFEELKSRFFDIHFTDDTIQVHVLESVQKHLGEGATMHRYVFSDEYYLKEDSLILSATIEGKRIETIEVSLKSFEAVQSRGVCNKNTEYHNQIVNLVNTNRKLIRQQIRTVAQYEPLNYQRYEDRD